jgi:hypothetical protein
MRKHKRFVALTTLFVAASLSGCAMTAEQMRVQQERQAQFMAARPICSNPRQCEAMWAAARNWVNGTCGMKIQTMTDSYLETFGSVDTRLACRVTKDPMPDGRYVLTVATVCGNPFGCFPDTWQAAFNFNTLVTSAGMGF